MTYTENVPLATQTKAFTQSIIEANFQDNATAWRDNHTFVSAENNNAIAGEANGSHQKMSMPNQSVDITGALPGGIATIMYAIGGNIFAWNGAKGPVSGVSGSGTQTINTVLTTILTLPANCIGLLCIYDNNVLPLTNGLTTVFFYSLAGVLYCSFAGLGGTTNVTTGVTGLNLKVRVASVGQTITNAPYKYIYWPA